MTDLEKLEYVHSTLQDMQHIFGIEDDMLSVSLKYVEDLREPHLQEIEESRVEPELRNPAGELI
jgi:hypothetical protein